jgi:hypothetical protein
MPTMLPPKRRRARPEPERDEDETDGDSLVPALIAITLFMATVVVYCDKYYPPHYYYASGADYSLAIYNADSQFAP